MPVHVDEMVSNVVPEPEPAGPAAGGEPEWRRVSEMREMHAQICRDRWRSAAEGFDD